MGNNDNTPMSQQASAKIVGPLWKSVMDYELNRIPVENFETPEPYETGLKPFLTGSWKGPGNEVHSELYWLDRTNPKGSAPGNSSNDEQFKNWEYSVLNWSTGSQGTSLIQQAINTENTLPNSNVEGFKIISPVNMSIIDKKTRQTIMVSGFNQKTISVEYYINGVSIGKTNEAPFVSSYIPAETKSSDFEDELKAVAIDSDGNKTESTVSYSIK